MAISAMSPGELMTLVESLRKVNIDLRTSREDLLANLTKLSEAISLRFDIANILELSADIIKDIIHYQACFYELQEAEGRMTVALEREMKPELLSRIEELKRDGIVDWVMESAKPIAFPLETGNGGAVWIVPLVTQEERLGLMYFFTSVPPEKIEQDTSTMVGILSSQAAVAIKNAILYRQMELKNVALSELKNYLNDVLEHITNGLVVIDPDGRIRTVNRCAENMFFLDGDAAAGREAKLVLPEVLARKIPDILGAAREGRKLSDFEVDIRISEEKLLPLRVSVSYMRDSRNELAGIILMLQDLSESREIQRLKEIDQMKSELVSNVSHELRTPLTSIKAYAESLLTIIGEASEIETQKEFLNIICEESSRLENLISNLLDLSRLESGAVALDFAETDVATMIKRVVQVLKEFASKNEVTIHTELNRLSGPVIVDGQKLEQVVHNLLSNAIKYNKKGGSVTVGLKDGPEGYFQIIVRDTGIGIPEEAIPRLFDKFYRVDSSLTYEVSGTGLGLAIVKHIIERHNGTINVRSKPGHGSEFIVTLPRRPA